MKKIYLADSKEWYLEEGQAQSYLDIMSTSYSKGIVAGEDLLLEELTSHLASTLCSPLGYVDLGPGDGKKTKYMITTLNNYKLINNYTAVDIQKKYLEMAEHIVTEQQIPANYYVSSFEEFLKTESLTNKIIYLGATYGNFDESFDKLLVESMGDSIVYLSSALFPKDIESTVKGYYNALGMFEPIAKRNKISVDQPFVEFNKEKNQIEIGFMQSNVVYVFGVSKKPTIQQFKDRIAKRFVGEYFVNAEHIGFVGRPRSS